MQPIQRSRPLPASRPSHSCTLSETCVKASTHLKYFLSHLSRQRTFKLFSFADLEPHDRVSNATSHSFFVFDIGSPRQSNCSVAKRTGIPVSERHITRDFDMHGCWFPSSMLHTSALIVWHRCFVIMDQNGDCCALSGIRSNRMRSCTVIDVVT
jgi:hypothetical protein